MPEILDLGEVTVPWQSDTNLLMELTHVRTHIRKLRYGEVSKVDGYSIEVTRVSGAVERWEFGSTVGYPTVDGVAVDWKKHWMKVEE